MRASLSPQVTRIKSGLFVMKYLTLISTILVLCAGCTQFGTNPFLKPQFSGSRVAAEKPAPKAKPRKPADHTLYFTLNSDPSGAAVYYVGKNATNYLGQTPIRFPLELTKRSMLEVLKGTKKPLWETYVSDDRPLEVIQSGERLLVSLSGIYLKANGYQLQAADTRWIFPIDLKERKENAWPQLIPLYYQTRTILSVPNEPQIRFKVAVDSRPKSAELYELSDEGKLGGKIGTLPLEFNLGMAGVRSPDNVITNWIRWNDSQSKTLWNHAANGDVKLSAVVLADGFQPEVIRDRLVANISPAAAGKRFNVLLESTIPSRPQRELSFTIDSLPSGSAVYELRDDGALGAKVGVTPFELPIGLAQELQFLPAAGYVHKDWRIWSPTEILKWQAEPSGETAFRLAFALYQEGFAVETVSKNIFTLKPGAPFPEGETLTFPLITPEQSAARESRELQRDLIQIQGAAAVRGNWASDPDWLRRTATAGSELRQTDGYVWSGPPGEDPGTNAPAKPEPWWKKVLPRR